MIRRRQLLRRRILSKYDTLAACADDIGISRQALSNIVSGRSYPSAKTMEIMRRKLGISDDELGPLFYEMA